MEYSVIPGLCEHLIHKLTDLSEGDFGMEDTVLVYQALQSINETLNLLVVSDRRPLPPTTPRLGGCATPTIIKAQAAPYINIWKI